MINVFESVRGRELPSGFKWLNEPEQWEFTDEGLIVQAEPRTDYFIDPARTAVKGDATSFTPNRKVTLPLRPLFRRK